MRYLFNLQYAYIFVCLAPCRFHFQKKETQDSIYASFKLNLFERKRMVFETKRTNELIKINAEHLAEIIARSVKSAFCIMLFESVKNAEKRAICRQLTRIYIQLQKLVFTEISRDTNDNGSLGRICLMSFKNESEIVFNFLEDSRQRKLVLVQFNDKE